MRRRRKSISGAIMEEMVGVEMVEVVVAVAGDSVAEVEVRAVAAAVGDGGNDVAMIQVVMIMMMIVMVMMMIVIMMMIVMMMMTWP